MRKFVGIGLLAAGLGVMLWGLGHAMYELIGIYGHALGDPLEQPKTTEQESADNILRFVLLAGAGVPFAVAGSLLIKIGMARRLHRRLRGRR